MLTFPDVSFISRVCLETYRKRQAAQKCGPLSSGAIVCVAQSTRGWEFLPSAKVLDIYNTGIFLWTVKKRC